MNITNFDLLNHSIKAFETSEENGRLLLNLQAELTHQIFEISKNTNQDVAGLLDTCREFLNLTPETFDNLDNIQEIFSQTIQGLEKASPQASGPVFTKEEKEAGLIRKGHIQIGAYSYKVEQEFNPPISNADWEVLLESYKDMFVGEEEKISSLSFFELDFQENKTVLKSKNEEKLTLQVNQAIYQYLKNPEPKFLDPIRPYDRLTEAAQEAPIGLTNNQNFCYANSLIQLAVNLPFLKSRLSSHDQFNLIFTAYEDARKEGTTPDLSLFEQILTNEENRQQDPFDILGCLLANLKTTPNGSDVINFPRMQAKAGKAEQVLQNSLDKPTFESAPDHLMVHTIRYDDKQNKLQGPLTIDSSERINISLDRENLTYRLRGFTVHLGEETTSGHYVAYFKTKNEDGKTVYYEANDEEIRVLTREKFLEAASMSTVSFYEKVEEKPSLPTLDI